MNTKSVQFVLSPQEPHWVGDGFTVNNFIPSMPGLGMYDMDPFILLDYNQPLNVPAGSSPKGVGVHPHRGFETVTLALKGRVEHHDSNDGGGVIGEDDVQWMTAARGVLHKEYYEHQWAKQGGVFHMVQLWVNLPAKDKMGAPTYQAISHDKMGRYTFADGSVAEVVAGRYKDVTGPAHTHSPISLIKLHLKAGGIADFHFPASHNTAVLVVEGTAHVNDETFVPTHNLAKFSHTGEAFTLSTSEGAQVIIMSGEPLKEPIVSYEPFVMNSRKEIQEAFEDFEKGAFGTLANE